MARTPRHRDLSSRRLRSAPPDAPSYYQKATRAAKKNELKLTSEKKDWKHATCPICLERPHDAVLLLCSSHNKGCRPYMCGTNYHQSNCLEQFKNAYVKEKPANEVSIAVAAASKKPKDVELACPICRGEVKGWTVVEPARQFLNRKKRTCIHEDCSFIGSYKKLCKHVKGSHPSSKPREVDPARLAEWKELESAKERQDAISIVTGLNPGSMIIGDYLIDPNSGSSDSFMDNSDWSDDSDSYTFPDGGDIMFSEAPDIRSLRRVVRRAYRTNGARPRQNVQRRALTISRSSGRRRWPQVGSALSARMPRGRQARSTNDS